MRSRATATRPSSCARAAATSRPGTPEGRGPPHPVQPGACRSTSSATASSWRRRRVGDKGRVPDHPGLAGRPPPPAVAAECPSGAGSERGRDAGPPQPHALAATACEQAHHCDDFDALLDVARTANASYLPPLVEAEVVKTARSAWGYTGARRQLVRSRAARASPRTHDVDWLLLPASGRVPAADRAAPAPLRARRFVVANAMAERMPGGGWTRKRFCAARRTLRTRQDSSHAASLTRPAEYRSALPELCRQTPRP